MTPQEAQMLQDLVRKVEGTPLNEKDPDAEALLTDGLSRDPDAIYKLAQTVLIQNLALEQARAQMQRMQQQLPAPQQQPAKATSFLGGLFHHNAPQSAPPQQYQAAPPYQPVNQGYAPPPAYPQGYAPAYGSAPSQGGGFLRSAATTAAGVAGGMLAFQGIESLLHGGFGGGGFGGGYGGGMPVEENVVNNYYEDPSQNLGGPDEQPQGPYDASQAGGQDVIPGPDEQPQGPYDAGQGQDDAQGYLDDSGGADYGSGDPGAGDPGSGDPGAGDSGSFVDDSGGGDFGGGDFGGDGGSFS